ncbi:MAG: M23 family metallopeptidase, partial [Pseudomonadota bacterium]
AAEDWGKTLEGQIDELTAAVEQAYDTIGAVASERDALREERVELETALVVANDRNRVVEERLTGSQRRSLTLSQDNTNLREQNAALTGQIQRIGNQLAAVREGQDQLFATLRSKNTAFIDGIETGLSLTGLNIEEMIADMVDQMGQAQGGPLLPLEDDAIDELLWNDAADLISMVGRAASLRTLANRLPIDRPVVAEHWISSVFGRRTDPITGRRARHEGIDFAGAPGTEILSTGSGRIAMAGGFGAYGLTVEIDHGIGLTTRYAHLKSISVEEGDTIAQGQVIGTMGSTGRSTGTHLHYEVRVDGEAVDPKSFLEAGEHVFETAATLGGE